MQVTPRIYQKAAVKAAVIGLRSRLKRALVVLATGLGKTMAAALIGKEIRAKRILFLVHNNFILKHAIDEFHLVFDEETVMVTYNGMFKKNGAKHADIVFATWQTMGKSLKHWARNHFDLIIVDEAHHSEADTYKPVLEYFNAPKLGITATPDREDKADIRDVFGPEVINVTLEEAIARGWLPRIEYHVITDESLDEDALQKISAEIRESKRRFTMAEVNRRIFIKKRDVEIARIINGYEEKSIVFCASITHAERFCKSLKLASTFHSLKGRDQRDTWKKNQATLEALKNGLIRRVCAVNAFNEGVNVPTIGVVAFCRVTGVLTVFRQQLGRGLRPGKDKLIVLDFVGNLERIQLVLEMMNKISDLHEQFTSRGEIEREGYVRQKFEVSGKGFEFTFSDRVVDLMKVLEHCEREFYPTWQEASQAAQELGIKSMFEYRQSYKKDPKLPSNPHQVYPDFSGYLPFLGKGERKCYYKNWMAASKAAQKLRLKTKNEYQQRYKSDSKLPAAPNALYSEFPGWPVFLGRQLRCEDPYPTWQQAGKAARRLGVKNNKDYQCLYKQDPRLPCHLYQAYPDFPGFVVFLGREAQEKYKTWQAAGKAARKLGIKTYREYKERCEEDPKLPKTPERFYNTFPGYVPFLGRKVEGKYATWQEAAKAAKKIGINSQSTYRERFKKDPRLPAAPEQFYADFPGFTVFMGGIVKDFYPTWHEARDAARKLGFKARSDYQAGYKKDSHLFSNPDKGYEDFPGWSKFLGKK